MAKLRVGIVGCGLVTQVEHLPNLLGLPDLFTVAGIADPSAKVRTTLSGRYGVPAFATADELMAQKIDAVLVATPDSYHADLVVAGLEHGLLVFS
jgi:predicted dehydrogenase